MTRLRNTKKLGACVSEYDMIRGQDGKPIFNEWYKPREEDDCSRADIARSYRLGRGY